jgi:hypothetical protein
LLLKKKRGLPKKSAFLAAYIHTASITKAAKSARVDRALHYRWLKDDEGYAIAFAAASEQAAQLLEDEAVRRAYEGVEEPLVYQGEFTYPSVPDPKGRHEEVDLVTGEVTMSSGWKKSRKPLTINKKSDVLLMFLLKGFRPEKYRDRVSAELSAPGGGPIQLEDKRLAKLTDEELAALVLTAQKLES